MADFRELAAIAAKEIITTSLNQTNHVNMYRKGTSFPEGVELANHLGDCYQALYKKIFDVIKS